MATEDQVIQLVASFVVALQPLVVVEVGAYEGDTSRAIGEALARNGRGRLYTVEIDAARADAARAAVRGLPVTVHTADIMAWTPPAGVEVAWIDGDSRYRERDARHIMASCRSGAVLGFHDTAQAAVKRQVDALGLKHALPLPTFRGVTFARAP